MPKIKLRKENDNMIYGYGRVSTKGQAKDGNSLEAQERLLKEYVAEVIYMDSFTGTKMTRQEFDKHLSENGNIRNIMICSLKKVEKIRCCFRIKETSNMQKKTPDYDNVFKTMKSKHKRLFISVINDTFGKNLQRNTLLKRDCSLIFRFILHDMKRN